MSSSSRTRTPVSTANANDSLFFDTVKRIYRDYAHRQIPTEKISLFSERLSQIWAKSSQSEGYRVIDYLERLIIEQKINDHFFILITSTLATNVNFFQSLLNDQQRFQRLLTTNIGKPIFLMR